MHESASHVNYGMQECLHESCAVADPGFGKGGDNIYKIVYIGGC